jgi:hypothetical protein
MPLRTTGSLRAPKGAGRDALAASFDFRSSFRCIEVKRSTGDARLQLPAGAAAPDEFWLIEIDRGIAYRATTVWRRSPNAVVRLTEPIKLDRHGRHTALTDLWRAAGGGESSAERRQSVRVRSRASGMLFMADEATTADCNVRNISKGGAKIRVSRDLRIARDVGLLLANSGVYFEAELVWRASDEAGLAFKARHELKGTVPSRVEQAKALCRRAE